MNIIDTHCDALLKLQMAKHEKHRTGESLKFTDSIQVETNFIRLKEGGVIAQFFAIFISPNIPSDLKWSSALEQIDLFYTEILEKNPLMKHIKKWEDLNDLREGEVGAILALEGADAFGNDLGKLRHLYRLGVLSIGITWNNANLCADGVGEPRGGGLTMLGKEVVQQNNENRIFTDVSHLSEKGFWDVMELADYPIASHSNVRALCEHPRNLYDNQITSMFAKDGLIHVVFYPPFINGKQTATISELIAHIDYLCSLGGVKQIGFGSDFDGIDFYTKELENASNYQNLINELLKRFSEEEVKGFAYKNFIDSKIFQA